VPDVRILVKKGAAIMGARLRGISTGCAMLVIIGVVGAALEIATVAPLAVAQESSSGNRIILMYGNKRVVVTIPRTTVVKTIRPETLRYRSSSSSASPFETRRDQEGMIRSPKRTAARELRIIGDRFDEFEKRNQSFTPAMQDWTPLDWQSLRHTDRFNTRREGALPEDQPAVRGQRAFQEAWDRNEGGKSTPHSDAGGFRPSLFSAEPFRESTNFYGTPQDRQPVSESKSLSPVDSAEPAAAKNGIESSSGETVTQLITAQTEQGDQHFKQPVASAVPLSGLPMSGLPKEPTTEARWLESGVATLFGAIVGLLLVLALAALILILSLKQIGNKLGDGKIQPTIRVEMTNPPFPIYVVQAGGFPAGGPAEQVAKIERQTRVLDFGEQSIPFQVIESTYADESQSEQARQKEQEESLLKQVFEENLELHRKMIELAAA
jgi:hypothetical protein